MSAVQIRAEYFNRGPDGSQLIREDYYSAQTFTPAFTHQISRVELQVYGGYEFDVTVGIYETDENGHPTGSSLCSATVDSSGWTSYSGGEWITWIFSTHPILDVGVKYAIVMNSDATGGAVNWRKRGVGSYPGGNGELYTESWHSYSWDLMFSEFYENTDVELRDYYNTGDDNSYIVGESVLCAQTFTPTKNYNITHIRMMLEPLYSPGTITVNIKEIDSEGRPTGDSLATGTIDVQYMASVNKLWYTILMTEYNLTAGTKYAIVLSADCAGVYIRSKSIGEYDGGEFWISVDGGLSWNEYDFDMMFEVYGNLAPVITDQSDDTDIELGKEVELFVDVEGYPTPDYQWYQDDIPISGEIEDTIEFYAESSGTYKCNVINPVGDIWSDPIILTVIGNPYTYRLFDLFIDANRED